jgi:hypothetical protein
MRYQVLFVVVVGALKVDAAMLTALVVVLMLALADSVAIAVDAGVDFGVGTCIDVVADDSVNSGVYSQTESHLLAM